MSLVDYASSDEEEDASVAEHQETPPQPSTTAAASQRSVFQPCSIKTTYDQQSQDATSLLPAPIEKLPDASLLLNSPLSSQQIGTDHSSLVATAMAENASRKRDSVESSSLYVRGKIPRGNLPNSKNIPDTSKGLLMPPQLHGRSNVVTEDINKLFVKKNSRGKS
ncbi:uncharacterized protein LOC130818826 [Amaranthus tricolor]|uniref:uncharacterized protein LOC130818826 n=1 Tax=Amaranthus tricolor TaxID=29722 RepID=UPI0025881198|nr:uncharacterized protein LOC130818826 [Amaranthus tricolor]